jgi:hypothetical protein
MQGEVSMKRFRLGLAGLTVLVGLLTLAFAGPAGAFHSKLPSGSLPGNPNYRGFDPMEASIPYVAWRGEEVRLVKCVTGSFLERSGEWQIIDWSGDPHVWPKFFDDVDQRTSAFRGQGDQDGRTCFAIDITSHKPGIAIVKLKIDADPPLVGEGDPIRVHQFNVIWMSLDQAILRNLSGGTGGPVGPITENPGQRNRIGVLVKGRVPLNEEFETELGAQRPALNTDSIVLPDAWVDLANTTLASTSLRLRQANAGLPAGRGGSAADFWDIHDSTGPYNTGNAYGQTAVAGVCEVPPGGVPATHNPACHVNQVAAPAGDQDCNGLTTTINDTVDNCNFGTHAEFGPFSRVFHDVSGETGETSTIGPFSPTRPDETLLSDSLLNVHDAPMPSALVRFSIAPPTATDPTTGVGSFSAVQKHTVYNRGGAECTTPTNLHCVTNPFSGAYIPPSPFMETSPPLTGGLTDDPDTASGIHGAFANDFEGYLPVSYRENPGLYRFWDIAEVRQEAVATPTLCVDPPRQGFRPTPSGPQDVAVYTDEHGEAQVQFNAGLGFFFDEFVVDETQRACLPVGIIGTANITAQVQYPFQPTTHAGVTSNILQKRIESLFHKGIICVPKPREEDDKVLCVAFGRDIDGTPLTGERVCVTALGDAFIRDFDEDTDSTREGDSTVCATLDPNPSEMEDLGTDLFPTIDDTYATETFLIIGRGSVRVIADFRDEHLEFGLTVSIPPGTPGGTTGATVGQPLGIDQQLTPVTRPAASTGVANSAPTVNGAAASGGTTPNVAKPTAAKRRATLAFVRIVKPLGQGAVRKLVLRVNSTRGSEKVQIKLIGKRGKVLGTVLRKVKTNRAVSVPNLRLPKAAVTVRAKVVLIA